MAVTFHINKQNYPSLQVGDTAYYIPADSLNTVGGFNIFGNSSGDQNDESSLVIIGKVSEISTGTSNSVATTTVIINDVSNDFVNPAVGSYLLFSKDNTVNLSSLVGYFSEATMVNNSTEKAEMFALSCEIVPSSK